MGRWILLLAIIPLAAVALVGHGLAALRCPLGEKLLNAELPEWMS